MMLPRRGRHAWVYDLDDEDLAFVKRFLLAGGSLKDLAAAYGISYPTVRVRLDRLIEKIKVLDSQRPMTEFERTLRARLAEGKIDAATLKALLAAHEKDLAQTQEAAHELAARKVASDDTDAPAAAAGAAAAGGARHPDDDLPAGNRGGRRAGGT